MATTPIYIKSLKLRNIRTFSEEVMLKLEDEDGTIPQWTLILGDNGIGKSTLLQCIAWMKPYLPYKEDNPSKRRKINKNKIQTQINDEENETFVRLVGENRSKQGYLEAVFIANRKLNKKHLSGKESLCKTNLKIKLDRRGKLSDVDSKFYTNKDSFYNDEIVIYAYSASRRLGKLNINDSELDDTIPSFIAERTELLDAEDILHTSNYAALGAESTEKQKYAKYINKVKEMLVSVLPNITKVEHIEISPPKIFDEYERQGNVVLTTKYGSKIPFKNASLGYRTTISWTIDLAWRLFKEYPKSQDPLKQPAIVLIDEIDLHLHPKWQREIMGNLSSHFPKVQFIATAHSPLMVQAAVKSNYAVVKEGENGVGVLNDPTGIDGWRVDQILTSEFFDLGSSRGLKYEQLMDTRRKLTMKSRLSKKEIIQLNKITKELAQLPSGENPDEIEDRQLIADVVSKIRKGEIKIKL